MQRLLLFMPAIVLAGTASTQESGGADARGPGAETPPAGYRSAFEGYRPFAEPELANWRKANEEVAAAAGHAGDRPGPGEGRQSFQAQPRSPESTGAHEEHQR